MLPHRVAVSVAGLSGILGGVWHPNLYAYVHIMYIYINTYPYTVYIYKRMFIMIPPASFDFLVVDGQLHRLDHGSPRHVWSFQQPSHMSHRSWCFFSKCILTKSPKHTRTKEVGCCVWNVRSYLNFEELVPVFLYCWWLRNPANYNHLGMYKLPDIH